MANFVQEWRNLSGGRWSRNLRSWEHSVEETLDSIVNTIILGPNADRVVWNFNKGSYSSKEGYLIISGMDNSREGNWERIWKLKIPPKIHFFIWKIERSVLPTADFLTRRLGNSMSPNCKWCNMNVENQDHLLWNCSLARGVWNLVADWWSLNVSQKLKIRSSIWESVNMFFSSKVRNGWIISLAAGLWSIWLSRNKLIFNNKKDNIEVVVYLIKIRAFKWLLASKSIKDELETLWMVNPVGVLLLFNSSLRKEEFIWWNTDLIGYTDGSWKSLRSGAVCGGMGGFLKDREDNLLFIFSGPTQAWCPLEAERNAVLFIFDRVERNSKHKGMVTICTDSVLLVNQFQKERAGFKGESFLKKHKYWDSMVSNHCFRLSYVPRDVLSGADELAKQGMVRSKVLFAWC